jgi:hypothetical protein
MLKETTSATPGTFINGFSSALTIGTDSAIGDFHHHISVQSHIVGKLLTASYLTYSEHTLYKLFYSKNKDALWSHST